MMLTSTGNRAKVETTPTLSKHRRAGTMAQEGRRDLKQNSKSDSKPKRWVDCHQFQSLTQEIHQLNKVINDAGTLAAHLSQKERASRRNKASRQSVNFLPATIHCKLDVARKQEVKAATL